MMTAVNNQVVGGGVYRVLNMATGRFYIGCTDTFKRRFRAHLGNMKRGVHPNKLMLADYAAFGPESFDFAPVLVCEKLYGLSVESLAIAMAMGPGCYNQPESAPPSALGKRMPPRSPEHCAKIAAAARGRKQSAETKAKMSAARRGVPKSAAHIAAISAALKAKGARLTDDRKAAISRRHLGTKHTDEHKAKISAGLLAFAARKGEVR